LVDATEPVPQALYRQGDVLLRRVATIPAAAVEIPREHGRIVLAHGEQTGHAHAIDAPADEATFLSTGQRQRFLRLMADVELQHEEHAAIGLPAGLYQVIQQREWTDAAGDEEQWRYAGD
jgi:hypothetical protein